LEKIKEIKQSLEKAKHELEVAQRQGQFELASRLRFATIPNLERQLPSEGEIRDESSESPLAMLHDRVTSDDIARVVAKATGIPVQNLMKGERDKLVNVSLLPPGVVSNARTDSYCAWVRWRIPSNVE
jgi:ATP-dependent Clp protease ATP-binding subunit ClpB